VTFPNDTHSVVFPYGAATQTTPEDAARTDYDVVVVGGGVAGSIVASELSQQGQRVLILEAGPGKDVQLAEYEAYLTRFYGAAVKDSQSPYPFNPNARMPRSTDVMPVRPDTPRDDYTLVQTGMYCTDTTYTRVLGGTTMHWEGKALRMLPEDFGMHARFGQGRNWPVSYDDLEPYYRQAERELGVSAEVEDQAYLGMHFPPGYVFPMHRMPPSYLDQVVARGVDGMQVELDGDRYSLKVRSFPQARNGIPNPAYDGGKGFTPVGAVSTSQVEEGERCQGNNNCVPICPVQAKYHAGKTLAKALTSDNVDILTQAVASHVCVDNETGRVSSIEYKKYDKLDCSDYKTYNVSARVYVLSAHAIENARLMLASGLKSTSGLMGCNLMDHAYLLTWGLLPDLAGTMRGTVCTGGITDLRGGRFRRHMAGFGVDIHNDGWGWATGSPYSDLLDIVDRQGKFGRELRDAMVSQISRQLLLAFMIDVPPVRTNKVSISDDDRHKDGIGNPKPCVTYEIPEYTMRGAAFSRRLARDIFARLGVEDHTAYDPEKVSYIEFEGEGYSILGGNHIAGTHIMGTSKDDSVVDHTQRSWDHENLYLIGGGSLPSVATSNITLTLAALAFRSSEYIIKQLRAEKAPTVIRTPAFH
jgi:choline dehydrogenase-like flavoprotein